MVLYLISTELRKPYRPVACKVLSQQKNSVTDELVIVSVTPPIGQEVYHTAHDLELLVLASRHQGRSILSGVLPLTVYVCALPEGKDETYDNLRILDWGELHGTEEAALKTLERWKTE